jgi:hypothetical protein
VGARQVWQHCQVTDAQLCYAGSMTSTAVARRASGSAASARCTWCRTGGGLVMVLVIVLVVLVVMVVTVVTTHWWLQGGKE